MDATHNFPASDPPLVGRFVASQAVLWFVAAPFLGLATARLAVWVQNYRAPLLIFPLLVGCGLGLLLVGLMRIAAVGHRPTIWCGAMLAGVIAALGQHYFSFLDFKTALAAKNPDIMIPDEAFSFLGFLERQATLGRPVTADYSIRGAAAWASWAVDALLLLLAASAIVFVALRAPYCPKCRNWYRTIRAGPIADERARRLADAASLAIDLQPREYSYRLSHCVGGCGPCRLELACRDRERTKVLTSWLSAERREQAMRALDATEKIPTEKQQPTTDG